MVASIIGINIGAAVSRRFETGHESWFARTARPSQPAKITRRAAIIDVAQDGPDRHTRYSSIIERDGIKIASRNDNYCGGTAVRTSASIQQRDVHLIGSDCEESRERSLHRSGTCWDQVGLNWFAINAPHNLQLIAAGICERHRYSAKFPRGGSALKGDGWRTTKRSGAADFIRAEVNYAANAP